MPACILIIGQCSWHTSKRPSTPSLLAEVAGYKDWNGANLQYGSFAYNLGEVIGWSKPPATQYSYILAGFTEPIEPGEEWLWHMHPQVVQAIGELGWR
jgi:quercetin dioxygenase-like cupin family protein